MQPVEKCPPARRFLVFACQSAGLSVVAPAVAGRRYLEEQKNKEEKPSLPTVETPLQLPRSFDNGHLCEPRSEPSSSGSVRLFSLSLFLVLALSRTLEVRQR